MWQEHITAALTERLRRQGADFKPADVTAFAAGVPDSEGNADVGALADRFVEASRIYAVEIARRNHAGRVLTVGVLVLTSGVVGLVLAAFGMVAIASYPPPHPGPVHFVMAGGASMVLALSGLAATGYGTACLASADARLKKSLRAAAQGCASRAA